MKDSITLRDDLAAHLYADRINMGYGTPADGDAASIAQRCLEWADAFVKVRNADPVYRNTYLDKTGQHPPA